MAFGGENAESYYDEGLTATVKGDLDRAIECFQKAIEFDKSFSSAYHQLGKCNLRVGNPERAAVLLNKVIENNSHLVPARIDLGYALLACGEHQEAGKHFRQILSEKPDNARALLGAAQVCYDAGQWDGAVTLAKEASIYSGNNFATLFLLGKAAKLASNINVAMDSLSEADKIIEKSIELNPDNPEGYYLRGELIFAQDQFAKALEFYRAAEDRAREEHYYSAFGENFTKTDILIKQAFCYQHLDAIDRARDIGKNIIDKMPDHKIAQALSEL